MTAARPIAPPPRRPARARLPVIFTLCALLAAACIPRPLPPLEWPQVAPPRDDQQLARAEEQFLDASSEQQLRAAVAAAAQAGPDSARYHELAAQLALLEVDWEARFDHLFAALLDPESDAPSLHLVEIADAARSEPQRERLERLLRMLAARHPSAEVRDRAAHLLADELYEAGEVETSRELRDSIGLTLPLALIGTWDNDQGKAFDTELPPEREIDLQQRYDGSLLEIGWRPHPPAPVHRQVYRLMDLFSPTRWVVAYGLCAVRVSQPGSYELRLDSGVATKVWIDGRLALAERTVQRGLFDQFVIPVELGAGNHRILIKSAQDTGYWALGARITAAAGQPPRGVSVMPPQTPPSAEARVEPWSTDLQLDARVARIGAKSARGALLRWRWATLLGLTSTSARHGDAFVAAHPKGIVGRFELSQALWDNAQRGRTADLLEELDEQVGGALPLIRLQRALLLRQDGLSRKARQLLVSARDAHPERAEVWLRLSDQFRADRWLEDRCAALARADALLPRWLTTRTALADCLSAQGFEKRAIEVLEGSLGDRPNEIGILARLQSFALDDGRLDEALRGAENLARLAPNRLWPVLRMAEAHRRRGEPDLARRALQRALSLNPDDADTYYELGRIDYETGSEGPAFEHWRASLERDPDNENLSNRLSFLAPEASEPWERDVPGEPEIDAAVARGAGAKAAPGANVLALLDHAVTKVNPDGTTINVVTKVMRAENDSGRDDLMQQYMGRGGRLRVLHAYAISPNGKRAQVSSTRGGTARFRGLEVGSTVVLQYRHDKRALGYLSRHFASGHVFQRSTYHTLDSEWTVWAASGTRFHEWLQGDVARNEQELEGRVRVSFRGEGLRPILPEPAMPGYGEVLPQVLLSTVPDWDTFLSWEEALLVDAFRESTDVRQLAERIFTGASGPQDKVERIHRYLMEEIRYQQDYESHIAGVKPHAASVVLRRGYGDCKDKAVLFITLARLGGVEVHFALLRTRPKGPLRESVPMQQFDHAIVYVPEQAGLGAGRFYDPTADALDIDVLRADDPGATALVLDPETKDHRWIPIPFQAPEKNRTRGSVRVRLDSQGAAEGTLALAMRGASGSSLRRAARNQSRLEQAMKGFVGKLYSGGTVQEIALEQVTSLERPAEVSLGVRLPAYGRREGRELRLSIHPVWSSQSQFQLESRNFPLVLGAPNRDEWHSEIELPGGARAARIPPDVAIDAPCFSLRRRATTSAGKLVVEQSFETTCERIEPAQYAEHRKLAEEAARGLREEFVLRID